MSFTYNKRMSNYQAMLPITPNNFHLKHHNIRGGDLTATSTTTPPAPPAPLIPLATLPETVSDWMNMSNDDLHRLTPSDINQLSNASFKLAFGGTRPLGNLMAHRVLDNASNRQLSQAAINNRLDIIRKSGVRGGALTATSTTPALPETLQDWQNMTDDELLKITPDDILNKISDASYEAAFPEASSANLPGWDDFNTRFLTNLNGKENPNRDALSAAEIKRADLIAWWVAPTDPLFNTTLQGIPKWWFKHFNQYSWVKSQVIMYSTYEDFQNTSFYKKYSTRIINIPPPRNFARYMGGEIPGQERKALGAGNSDVYLHNIYEKYGQKWRVMFNQGDLSGHLTSGNDYYVYYIDCKDLNDYLDMLEEFYNDRDTLQPNEVIIMLNLQYRAAVAAHERELMAQGYSEGEAAEEAKEAAAKETSEDSSSSIWGDIGEGLEVASMFL